jgi:aminoglycoside phosphotransferase (APT) family kinase protein
MIFFFIQCENDSNKYVLKICGNAWTKRKTESEVNAINLVHQYTNIPLPKLLAYSAHKTNEFGVEWIVMTRLIGKPLRSSLKID